MIGKVVVGLLAVLCFSCNVTADELPSFDHNYESECNSYDPEASFGQIIGLAYVALFSGGNLSCLTLDIEPITGPLGLTVAFNSTNSFNNNGNIVSQQSTLIPNPLKPGQAQSYVKDNNGTYTLTKVTVLLIYDGSIGGIFGFDGYVLVSCPAGGGTKLVAIVLEDLPLQDDEVSELQAQLNATDPALGGTQLYSIVQGDTYCVYP